MFQLLESIRINDGKPENLDYHYRRIASSLTALFGRGKLPPLKEILGPAEAFPTGIYKCRLLYSANTYRLEFLEYSKRDIQSLVVVEKPGLSYNLKYSDRSVFDNLIEALPAYEEIIISHKGLLTDTSYTNIALLKNGTWHTPAVPLLEGTQRGFLLDKGVIRHSEISIKDIPDYSRIKLFNAMMPWDDCIELDINKISVYE